MADPPVTRILLVEADARLARELRETMRTNAIDSRLSTSPLSARSVFTRFQPDLVVLDLDPSIDVAWRFFDAIRARSATPIVVVSARASQHDIVSALERGADDFVAKPIPMNELLARIRAGLRRLSPRPPEAALPSLRVNELAIDLESRSVARAGVRASLTRTECTLLGVFVRHPDKVLTERMLIEAVWGTETPANRHLLQVYIGRLRRKLEVDPTSPEYLVSEPRAGYRLLTSG
jgi:two-component system KDP operon response regulator KdpE